MSGDLGLFLSQLIRKPHQVVALAPSSRALAAEMAATLDPDGGPVIELGAGTGKITRSMIERGISAQSIHAIEMNPVFCDRLRTNFPGLNVHQNSAADVGNLPVERVQAVVSGLPLLSMPFDLQKSILSGTFAKIGAEGRFIQFTYGPKPPIKAEILAAMGLNWSTSRKIWGNLPPARVYRFSRPMN